MRSKIIQILTSNNYDGYQDLVSYFHKNSFIIWSTNDETDLKA